MEIDQKLVQHLASLSRLSFSSNEELELLGDLQKMIGFIEKLNELDTTGTAPLRHINALAWLNGLQSPLRADETGQMLLNQDALREAAETHPPFFVVPKVLQQ